MFHYLYIAIEISETSSWINHSKNIRKEDYDLRISQ